MIFITGATGFTGSYLLYILLEKGYKVRALKRESSTLSQTRLIFDFMLQQGGKTTPEALENPEKVEWVTGDVGDVDSLSEALTGIDAIFHVAGMVAFSPSDCESLIRINVVGTRNLVDLAIDNKLPFVFISSVASLPRKHNQFVDETFPAEHPKFSSPYATSKFRSEMEVWRGYGEGLKVLVVNPGIILGPCEFSRGGGSADFFNAIYEGVPFMPKGGNAFVDVRDVARKTIALFEKPDAWNERYIMTGANVSYEKIMKLTAEKLGVKPPRFQAGLWMGYAGVVLDLLRAKLTGRKQKLTPALVYTAAHNFFYDSSKVEEALGEGFISLEKMLDDACAAYTR